LGEACLRERVLDSLHQRGELHVARDEPVSAVGKVWFELQQALDSGGGLVSPIVGDQCHLGRLDFDGIPARVECAREYEPNGGHRQTYDTAFEALTDLYRANKGIYRRLNRGHGH
jgi:hypothetical protein